MLSTAGGTESEIEGFATARRGLGGCAFRDLERFR